jgi:hypothetical protein
MNHLFKKFFRQSIRVEGFDSTGEDTPTTVTDNSVTVENKPLTTDNSVTDENKPLTANNSVTVENKPLTADNPVNTSVPVADTTDLDTDKSTLMVELFENVNKQMDMIRTLKLGDKIIPIKIDKTPSENVLVLANLKLLINNGVYKNELDLKEVYDKYIGNKAIQLLTSDINSLNLDKPPNDISTLETKFLARCKSVVDAHQKVINKIFDNKSKE